MSNEPNSMHSVRKNRANQKQFQLAALVATHALATLQLALYVHDSGERALARKAIVIALSPSLTHSLTLRTALTCTPTLTSFATHSHAHTHVHKPEQQQYDGMTRASRLFAYARADANARHVNAHRHQ